MGEQDKHTDSKDLREIKRETELWRDGGREREKQTNTERERKGERDTKIERKRWRDRELHRQGQVEFEIMKGSSRSCDSHGRAMRTRAAACFRSEIL